MVMHIVKINAHSYINLYNCLGLAKISQFVITPLYLYYQPTPSAKFQPIIIIIGVE